MQIHLVSTRRNVLSAFDPISRGRDLELVVHDSDSGLLTEESGANVFFYIDVSGMDLRAVRRKLTQLEKSVPHRFGIVDPNDEILDPAEVFHKSAADYVGKRMIKERLSSSRIRRVLEFSPIDPEPEQTTPPAKPLAELTAPPSGNSWEQIRPGKSYTFLMVYAGIDRMRELRRKLSEEYLSRLRKSFLALLQEYMAPYGSALWMWKEDDGLLLIPFDGSSLDSVTAALLLRLNWPIHQTDDQGKFGELSWRLGFHLGVTPYQSSGKTGSIVSEDVNFVFHFGASAVKPGSISCTASVFHRLPERLQALFVPDGSFESRDVYRLKQLL